MLYRPSYHMYMEGAHDKDEAWLGRFDADVCVCVCFRWKTIIEEEEGTTPAVHKTE
jgi:hypothetical protein